MDLIEKIAKDREILKRKINDIGVSASETTKAFDNLGQVIVDIQLSTTEIVGDILDSEIVD